MQDAKTPAPAPKDNLFGVCAALGQDFNFNPLWLRLALGVGLLFNAGAVIASYFVAGAIVLLSRLIVKDQTQVPAAAAPLASAEQDVEREPLRHAA